MSPSRARVRLLWKEQRVDTVFNDMVPNGSQHDGLAVIVWALRVLRI